MENNELFAHRDEAAICEADSGRIGRVEEIESILGGMQETLSLVSDNDASDGYREYFVETTDDAEISEFLISKLTERKCSIREIARLEPNLEDIFIFRKRPAAVPGRM